MTILIKGKPYKNVSNKDNCSILKQLSWNWVSNIVFISLSVWLIASIVFVNVVEANEKLQKVRCEKDTHGNNNCTCAEDPITDRYTNHEDEHCESYYLCHLGVAIKLMCAQYWAFHPKLRECLPRSRIPNNICKPLVNCPVFPNRYIEDSNDCTKYYLCYYGRHFHWACPEYHYFEPNKEKCLPDRDQAEACMVVAKKNFYEKLGYTENPPPKTTVALDKAQAYRKAKKG